MIKLSDYRDLVGDRVLYDIYKKSRKLCGKRIININSTSEGGGVAEILNSLIPLMNDVGIFAGWRVLHGSPDFFSVTKKFHNALQGQEVEFSEEELDLYKRTNEEFSSYTHLNHDMVIIHDPQPMPLINYYRKKQPWVSRIHIDISKQTPSLEYLKNFLIKYDKLIVSSDEYIMKDFPLDQKIITPAIDPFTIKNKKLRDHEIKRILDMYNIPTDKPIITQVSRFDKWKQPNEVIDIFEKVRKKIDCRLILIGGSSSDDPEGIEIFNKVKNKAEGFGKDIILITVESGSLVNAIQSISDVIIQFSLKEGFCLCVTEGMYKGKLVIGTNVGGIPLQIKNGENGFLVEPNDIYGCADRVIKGLKNKKLANELGENAKKTVIEKFLMTRLLDCYLQLITETL